jgi:hypothetical protein
MIVSISVIYRVHQQLSQYQQKSRCIIDAKLLYKRLDPLDGGMNKRHVGSDPKRGGQFVLVRRKHKLFLSGHEPGYFARNCRADSHNSCKLLKYKDLCLSSRGLLAPKRCEVADTPLPEKAVNRPEKQGFGPSSSTVPP